MRFDPAVWKSLPGAEGWDYWMTAVHDRARRFAEACHAEGIPFNVCGGMAVMAWVASINPDFIRTTKDVDVIMRRGDMQRAADALPQHGFFFAETNGVPMFLDGADGTPKHAVHVVVVGERRRLDAAPVPDFTDEALRHADYPWPRLALLPLITSKLIASRPHDIAHLCDMARVGLIDRAWRDRLPEPLRERFDRAMDDYDRYYRDSAH
jgi:hypothetical protein